VTDPDDTNAPATRLLLAVCMRCGGPIPVRMNVGFQNSGYRFHNDYGWLCKRCDSLDTDDRSRR